VGASNSGHYATEDKTTRQYADQSHMKWRLEVTEQKGRALHAKWCSDKNCESAVGAFRRNGDLLLADEDTLFIGSVQADKLELCGMEAGTDYRFVTCRDLIKQ
jgi:hypothetical protein